MLTAGIVGLPNVGKSTLFKAITKMQVLIENYPFATIEPNVGTCLVQDKRIYEIARIFKPEKVIPTTLKLHDIAGLVKGASQGQGLGNQFLANIRNVDALCEVIRCFEDSSIVHNENKIDPVADFELIEYELILSDLELTKKRWDKIAKKAKAANDKETQLEAEVLKKVIKLLEQGLALRFESFTETEKNVIEQLNLLTMKPIILIANIAENDLSDSDNKYVSALKKYAQEKNLLVVSLCAKLESEFSELEEQEKREYMDLLNLSMSGVDQFVLATYQLLKLATFFTAGPKEVRAWTFIQGMSAAQCAGIIHSDFEKGFIRAQIYNYHDLVSQGSEKNVKEAGKNRSEGKSYQLKDGDICHFLFNV